MNRKLILQVLQFFVFSLVALLFFRYVYSGQDLGKMVAKLLLIDPKWVLYSMLMALASHLSRAARWCLAVKPLGYRASVFPAFLAVLFGYFINSLPVPRLGEFARCWLFAKTSKVPVAVGLGSVIAERVVDLLMLLLITSSAILIEYDRLIGFLSGEYSQNRSGVNSKLLILFGLALFGLLVLFVLYRLRAKLLAIKWVQKIVAIFVSLQQGLLGLSKLSKIELGIYLAHTIFIWLMYYGMAYVLVFSMSETAALPPVAGLTMVAMGGIGMAFPTPAGVGSYHYFMTQALLLYAVPEVPAKEFAFLLHSSQVLMALGTGVLALLISQMLIKRQTLKPF
jgi:uncharacterized protein (TIRG00374 family)